MRATIHAAMAMVSLAALVACGGAWLVLTGALDARLQLLDYFDLRVDGSALPVGESAMECLAYLGVVGMTSRERMCAALWPDAEPEESLSRLRSLLYRLRQAGTGRFVQCGPSNRLQLDPSLGVDYQHAVRTAEGLCTGRLPAAGRLLESLEDLRADLLPNDTFEWITPHQRHWSRSRLRGLAVCARTALVAYDTETAIQAAELVIRSEPYFEEMYEVIVQALIADGFVVSAREAYERLETLLRDELDCRPRRAFREIAAGAVPVHAATGG